MKTKATSGNVHAKTPKMIARDIWVPLTDCINSTISNGVFPDELKLADVTPLYKKGEPDDKTNYQPISVCPSLFKVYEKVFKQLHSSKQNSLLIYLDFVRGITHSMLHLTYYLIGTIA